MQAFNKGSNNSNIQSKLSNRQNNANNITACSNYNHDDVLGETFNKTSSIFAKYLECTNIQSRKLDLYSDTFLWILILQHQN
jgi:hypothetical protein